MVVTTIRALFGYINAKAGSVQATLLTDTRPGRTLMSGYTP
jgi:hypothetical protein